MLRIQSAYATASMDGRDAPVGLRIVREDGVRLVADLSIRDAADLVGQLTTAMAAAAMAPKPEPKRHTVRGKPIGPEGSPYGVTHDYDCPGCEGTSFTASPRSETYWSS